MQEHKRPLRYDEFIFKLQFHRKIHPMAYMLSKPALKVIGVAMAIYFFYPSGAEWIFGIGGYILLRKYSGSKMSYKAKLAAYVKGREDESVPVLSFYSQKKEHYLKNQLKAQHG